MQSDAWHVSAEDLYPLTTLAVRANARGEPQLQTVPLGLLEVRLHINADHESELNDWYDREHVPELLRVPGVLSATRYTELSEVGKMYRAFYELQNEQVILSGEFRRLLTCRTPWSTRMYSLYDNRYRRLNTYRLLAACGAASPFNAKWLYCFKTDVAAHMEREFNKSYDDDLLMALAAVPGCIGARRFVAVDGQEKYMAIYGLENTDVVNAEPWQMVANTARRTRIRAHLQNPTRGYFELLRPTVTA